MSLFSKITETLSINNFQRLLHALRTEPPKQVLRNVMRYTSGKSRPVIQRAPGLLFCCEYAVIIQQKLLLGGWAVAEKGIETLKIICHQKDLGQAIFSVNRPDIERQYPNYKNALQSGFVFDLAEIEKQGIAINQIDKIDFEVLLQSGASHSFSIKLMKLKDVLRFLGPATLDMNEIYQVYIAQEPSLKSLEASVQKENLTNSINILLLDAFVDSSIVEQIESIERQVYKNWNLLIPIFERTKDLEEAMLLFQERENIHFIEIENREAFQINNFFSKRENTSLLIIEAGVHLMENCLFALLKNIQENPKTNIFYSDQDSKNATGKRLNPKYKSDYNRGLLLSHNYIGGLLLLTQAFLKQIPFSSLNLEEKGSFIYDLLLKEYDRNWEISRIPEVLFHQTTLSPKKADWKIDSEKKAIERFVAQDENLASVEEGLVPNTYRIRPKKRIEEPITIVMPFKDDVATLKTCVESIFEKTSYSNYQLFLVSNNSSEKATFNYLNQLSLEKNNVQWKAFDVPFNYAQINNWAIKQCESDLILLLNNDTEVINPDWLEAMVETLQMDKVGAVGAKLFYPDDTIQHAGVIVGYHGVADHAFSGFERADSGYGNRINLIQDYSVCTAACLLLRKQLFEKVGGFDEENFKINFNDVDLCLKIIEQGHRVVYTPFAQLYHFESKSRGDNKSTPEKRNREAQEIRFFKKKWGEYLKKGDPFYNPNLTLDKTDFSLKIRDL